MLDEFKKWLRIHKDSTPNTIESYENRIKVYLSYTDGIVDQQSLNDFIEHRLDKGVSVNTLNQFYCALRVYCEFRNIELNIPKAKKVNKTIKGFFTEEELRDSVLPMVSLIFREYDRNYLIIRFMFYTGLRNSEVCELRVDDIDFKNNIINVKNTKSKVDRIVPIINNEIKKEIKEWIEKHGGEKVFDVSDGLIRDIFSKLKRESNITKDFTPHIMRHSCAKHLIRLGVDVTIVQRILGHSDINTTMLYAEPDNNMVIEAINKIRS